MKHSLRVLAGIFVVGICLSPLLAGDAYWGRVAEVRSANVVVLTNDHSRIQVRIVGIEIPAAMAERARQAVAQLVLDKLVRLRLDGRTREEFIGRLTIDGPNGSTDVGLTLVRAGMARKLANYDYKYGRLSAAEEEARRGKRGIWNSGQ
jgi:endonuclease YncB( thermonuclease family)